MARTKLVVALLTLLSLSSLAGAHGGHKHEMGTVLVVATDYLEIKQTDGRQVLVHVDDKTRYSKDKAKAS